MQELVENIIRQADFLLKEQGEFYPFATVISRSGELRPLGLMLDSEHPDARLVIEQLELLLEKGIRVGEYLSAAMGINVIVNKDNQYSSDALEIRIKPGQDKAEKTLCLPYHFDKTSGELTFGKFISLD